MELLIIKIEEKDASHATNNLSARDSSWLTFDEPRGCAGEKWRKMK
jgi:hypothetical protein